MERAEREHGDRVKQLKADLCEKWQRRAATALRLGKRWIGCMIRCFSARSNFGAVTIDRRFETVFPDFIRFRRVRLCCESCCLSGERLAAYKLVGRQDHRLLRHVRTPFGAGNRPDGVCRCGSGFRWQR